MAEYFIVLEPGRIQDTTAIAIAEIIEGDSRAYHLRHLERLPAGTPYPEMAAHLSGLMLKAPLQTSESSILIDATGVALPVARMLENLLRRAGVESPVHYSLITNGDTETQDSSVYRIPRRDLASTLQVMLQSERLRIAPALAFADMLRQEMVGFQIRTSPPGQADNLIWREGASEDLVLAVALACWGGERLSAEVLTIHFYW